MVYIRSKFGIGGKAIIDLPRLAQMAHYVGDRLALRHKRGECSNDLRQCPKKTVPGFHRVNPFERVRLYMQGASTGGRG